MALVSVKRWKGRLMMVKSGYHCDTQASVTSTHEKDTSTRVANRQIAYTQTASPRLAGVKRERL